MSNVKKFVHRGLVAAWGGPVVLAIVYFILDRAGVIDTLTVGEVVKAILSMIVMAFIAGGISFIYDVEKLPIAMATLIQMAVLYCDYLLFYLLNGWVPTKGIGLFTIIFVVGFIVIWLIVYFCVVKRNVAALNKKIQS